MLLKTLNRNLHRIVLMSTLALSTFNALVPIKNWLRWSDFQSVPLPTIPWEDSVYYLSQVRAIIQGDNPFGNPIFTENRLNGGDFSFGNSFLFVFWGLLAKVLGLQLLQIYIVMIVVNSVFFALSCYLLSKLFIGRTNAALISSIVVLLIGSLGRPSPTQQMLGWTIFTLYFYLMCVGRRKSSIDPVLSKELFIYTTLFVILVASNPLYAGYLLLFTIIYELSSKVMFGKKRKFCFTKYTIIGFIFCLAYALYTNIETDSAETLMALRFGVHQTRIPGAITLVLISGLGLAVSLILMKRTIKSNEALFSIAVIQFSINLSLLLAINSQVFTGKAYEMESHFRLLSLSLNLLVLSCLSVGILKIWNLEKMYKVILSIVSFSMVLLHVTGNNSALGLSNIGDSEYTKFLQVVDGKKLVILVQDDTAYRLSELLIYTTDAKLYWHPYIAGSKASDAEVINRFACSRKEELLFDSFKLLEPEIYFHRFANEELKLSRAGKFIRSLKSDLKVFQREKTRVLKRDYRRYITDYEKCNSGEFKYKIDLVVRADSGFLVSDRA